MSKYRVEIIESDRFMGQKLDEVRYFETKDSALGFVREYNKGITEPITPEWYMVASYCGQV